MKDNIKHNRKKDFIFLPYKKTISVNCSEESLLERVRFRANTLGYSQPIVNNLETGERQLVLYAEKNRLCNTITPVNISIDLSELKDSGKITVKCWSTMSGIFALLVAMIWCITIEVIVVVKTHTQWIQMIPFYLILVLAQLGIILMHYNGNRSGGKHALEYMLRPVSRGRFS